MKRHKGKNLCIYFTSNTVFVSECVVSKQSPKITSHGVSIVFHRGQLGQTKKSTMPGNPVSESNLKWEDLRDIKLPASHDGPRLQLEMIDLPQGREY